MTPKIQAVACAAVLALGAVAPAAAQAPAAPGVTHGPAVPGLCVLSIEAAIAGSQVGGAVNTRLQQLIGQVNAELTADRTTIETEDKALTAQRTTLDANTLESRSAALQVKANAFQRKAQLRDREMQATEQKALERVGQEMQPLIQQVYQQKRCSMLLNRQAVVMGSPAMEITPDVITALNAKIKTLDFSRERLDQPQAGAAQPAAPGSR